MKYHTYENGGSVTGFVTISGMNPTGYVKLRVDPVDRIEAATKRYVDSLSSSNTGEAINSGIFISTTMPGFGGQVYSEDGNAVIYLNDGVITPDTYTKISVEENGLVSSGGILSSIDIPSLSWSKITSSVPDSLEGYGITDAVNKNDAQVIGLVRTTMEIFENEDVVNKFYVDTKNVTSKEYSVGDLLFLESDQTPTGFLRCNGGEISKTTYVDLYSVVGDTFGTPVVGGAVGINGLVYGSGRPWQQQFYFNTQSNIDFTGLTETSDFPVNITDSGIAVTKNRVYILGGAGDAGTATDNIYTAPINQDGTLGTWTISGTLPTLARYSTTVMVKNKLYIVGGYVDSLDIHNTTIYYADVNTDGTLGSWNTGPSLPIGLSSAYVIVTTDKLHVFGGGGGQYGDNIEDRYTSTINSDGTLTNWTTHNGLNSINGAVAVANNKVYVFDVTYAIDDPTPIGRIMVSDITETGDLGPWTSLKYIPHVLVYPRYIVTSEGVWIFSTLDDMVQPTTYAIKYPFTQDGGVGDPIGLAPYEFNIGQGQIFATSDKIYIIGGRNQNFAPVNDCLIGSFTGGLNDYTEMNQGLLVTTASGSGGGGGGNTDNFTLPDYTNLEDLTTKIYIKY